MGILNGFRKRNKSKSIPMYLYTEEELNEYEEQVKPSLVRLAARYPYYTEKVAEILGCTKDEVEPFIHLSILAINNYMIFAERALFEPQIESVKKELMRLAEKKRKRSTTEEN